MKVNTKELLEAIKAVKPGLASKEIIEHSTYFLFRDGQVQTYNDEISIAHPTAVDIEGAVPAEELYNLLSKIMDKEVEIMERDGEVIVKGKKFKAGISLESKIKAPTDEIPTFKNKSWKNLPEDFTEAVRICVLSAGRDMTKPNLTCLNIDGEFMEATDTLRLTRYEMSESIKNKAPILVPATNIKELLNYSPIKFQLSTGWIHFKTDNDVIFSCRTFHGEYPDIDHILKVKGQNIVFPKSIISSFERAEIFSKPDPTNSRMVEVNLDKGVAVIQSVEGERGWFCEDYKVRYTGKPVGFLINPAFLKEIIGHLRKAVVNKDSTRLLFESEKYSHVISLMKKKDEVPF